MLLVAINLYHLKVIFVKAMVVGTHSVGVIDAIMLVESDFWHDHAAINASIRALRLGLLAQWRL
jgi:hypothetical protein